MFYSEIQGVCSNEPGLVINLDEEYYINNINRTITLFCSCWKLFTGLLALDNGDSDVRQPQVRVFLEKSHIFQLEFYCPAFPCICVMYLGFYAKQYNLDDTFEIHMTIWKYTFLLLGTGISLVLFLSIR